MKIAVITPYHKPRPDWLRQCHESVRAQSHPCTHILVADGEADPQVEDFDAQHMVLPVNIHDYGDTPRAVGSLLAIAQGFDAFAYLDADNWFDPDHIASLVALHQQIGAAVCVAERRLHRLDGSLLGPAFKVPGQAFVDTNCYLLTRAAFGIEQVWYLMLPQLHAVDDRVFWHAIQTRGLSVARSGRASVAYRTAFEFHYECYGEQPPPGCKVGRDVAKAVGIFEKMIERSRAAAPAGAPPAPSVPQGHPGKR